MREQKSVEDQLKRIGFNQHAWGRAEVKELPNILLPDETIFECVNGVYEGGFALLVSTDVRVLLIDKKPFNYLTVEDLRFDMINEIDYYHRVFGAHVDITTGNRELKFHSYNNRERLRKLITHVQRQMADIKKRQDVHQEGQNQHLEQINDHLKAYLLAQHKHQEELQRSLEEAQRSGATITRPKAPRPSPELSDYLLAHGLMERYESGKDEKKNAHGGGGAQDERDSEDLLIEGLKEVFGTDKDRDKGSDGSTGASVKGHYPFDINPLRIAYSKLPMAMRNRKFGRPSLHDHSQSKVVAVEPNTG